MGTYGMASAQIYAFPWWDWGFVFVDDLLWLLRREQAPLHATAILLLLLAMGTPLSWKEDGVVIEQHMAGVPGRPTGAGHPLYMAL